MDVEKQPQSLQGLQQHEGVMPAVCEGLIQGPGDSSKR